MELESLWRHDFEVSGLYTMQQTWRDGEAFTFRLNARPEHGLLYFSGADAVFETRDRRQIPASRGDIFFLSKHSGYSVRFFNCAPCPYCDLLVNFQLRDEAGRDFAAPYEVLKLEGIDGEAAARDIQRMNEIYYGMTYLPGEMKGILYQMLTSVSRQLSGRQGRSAGRLEPALQWLERHFYEETSIRELAALCCMSESGFRRLFTAYAGVSPGKYRQLRRMDQAKRLMDAGLTGVGEIAAAVGIDDMNYFSRLFRRTAGMTPSEYMKK